MEGRVHSDQDGRKPPAHTLDGEGPGINCQLLSRQFRHGEITQICAVRDGDSLEIGVYGEDGEWETLLSDAPAEYRTRWYLGEDGVGYALTGKTVIRVEGGEESCRWGNVVLSNAPNQAISVQDGRVLVGRQRGMGKWYIAGTEDYKRLGEEAYRELYTPTEEIIEEIRGASGRGKAFLLTDSADTADYPGGDGAYFAGDKEAEEVIEIIENRVGLCLKEHR